jgi:hypothetical protein
MRYRSQSVTALPFCQSAGCGRGPFLRYYLSMRHSRFVKMRTGPTKPSLTKVAGTAVIRCPSRELTIDDFLTEGGRSVNSAACARVERRHLSSGMETLQGPLWVESGHQRSAEIDVLQRGFCGLSSVMIHASASIGQLRAAICSRALALARTLDCQLWQLSNPSALSLRAPRTCSGRRGNPVARVDCFATLAPTKGAA